MDGKIAIEEHFAITETIGDSAAHAIDGGWTRLEQRLLQLGEMRLREMDESGIAYAIVSLNSPGVQGLSDVASAVNVARRANDILAAAVAKRPDRFGGFAALPMQDPDAAVTELKRAVLELGFKGALVNGFSQVGSPAAVVYYDAPSYLPFWGCVEDLGVPFYLHPRDTLLSRGSAYEGHPWFTGSAWAFGAETAIHALRLMGSGLFDRYPELCVILGHLGEGIPYNLWRLDHRLGVLPRGIPAQRTMTEYLRTNVFLTTSGHFRDSSLTAAINEVGADRIIFSVDYPFEEMHDAAAWFDALPLSRVESLKIGKLNAIELFGLQGAARNARA